MVSLGGGMGGGFGWYQRESERQSLWSPTWFFSRTVARSRSAVVVCKRELSGVLWSELGDGHLSSIRVHGTPARSP
jgi:hypothetical protein